MALLGDGKLRGLPGGVDQYLELRAGAQGGGNTGAPTDKSAPPRHPRPRARPKSEKREARKELNRVERQMNKLEALIKKLHAEMASASEAMKFDQVATLNATLQGVEGEKDDLELAWLEAAETLGE